MKKLEKNWLYKKYKEEHQEAKEVAQITESLKIKERQVVIKKVSTLGKIVEVIEIVFFKIVKLVMYGIITFLLSLSVTVLINEELRELVFQIIGF